MNQILKSELKSITKNALILLAICLVLTSCKKEKTRICDLYESNVDYAVGTIEIVNSSPLKAVYVYNYIANGTKYTGEEMAYGIDQDNDRLVGKQFIVVYALDNPSNSDLNIDYMLETNQDFDDFKSKYAAGPPSPDYPNKCK